MSDINQLQISGTTYDIADTTAREKNEVQDNELNQVKSALQQTNDATSGAQTIPDTLVWLPGIIRQSDDTPIANDRSIYTPSYYPISQDAKITFTGDSTNRAILVYCYDKAKNILSRVSNSFNMPAGTCYLRFAFQFTSTSGITVESYGGVDAVSADWALECKTPYDQQIDAATSEIDTTQKCIAEVTGNGIVSWVDRSYINTSGSQVDFTPVPAVAWRHSIMDCNAGDVFTITAHGGSVPRVWCFVDANNNAIAVADSAANLSGVVITAPEGATKLVLNDTDKTGICFTNQAVIALADDNKRRIDRIANGNVMPIGTTSRTSNGVTYTPDGAGNYIADGTASSTSYYLIYNNTSKLPEFFIPGESYFCDYWSDDLYIAINAVAYKSDGTNTSILDTAAPKSFTVPLDAVGMVIRIKIGTGHVANNRLIAPKMYATKSLGGVSYKQGKNCAPMLTIVYDDGHSDFNTYVMPIIRAKNIPIATAVVPEAIGQSGYSMLMDWDTIKACYLDGAEVLTHFNAYTEEEWNGFGTQQISARYYKSINAIRAHGIYTPNALIFSGSSSRYPVSRAAAHRVFDAGFNASNGGINYYSDIDPWFINRYGTDNQTLATLKGWIDDLVAAKTGWAVWTRHNSNATQEDQATAAQVLSDAIDYALSKGVQIVTVERGLREYLDM